jgi:hypothetical protein
MSEFWMLYGKTVEQLKELFTMLGLENEAREMEMEEWLLKVRKESSKSVNE